MVRFKLWQRPSERRPAYQKSVQVNTKIVVRKWFEQGTEHTEAEYMRFSGSNHAVCLLEKALAKSCDKGWEALMAGGYPVPVLLKLTVEEILL